MNPTCPECKLKGMMVTEDVKLISERHIKGGIDQRYYCKRCGHNFHWLMAADRLADQTSESVTKSSD